MPELHLETKRLIIRNWIDKDRDLFHLINSDEKVMEYFPSRRDRKASNEFMDWINQGIERDGYGLTAIALKETNQPIGFCGLHTCKLEPLFPANMIEIGWRLAPEFWGKGYATEAAIRLLEFGFTDLQLDEIVSFAVHLNQPSIAVMQRIGMIPDPSRDFDHPRVPDTHPHLKRHTFYFAKSPYKKGA